jgi:hypothetical protein
MLSGWQKPLNKTAALRYHADQDARVISTHQHRYAIALIITAEQYGYKLSQHVHAVAPINSVMFYDKFTHKLTLP